MSLIRSTTGTVAARSTDDLSPYTGNVVEQQCEYRQDLKKNDFIVRQEALVGWGGVGGVARTGDPGT